MNKYFQTTMAGVMAFPYCHIKLSVFISYSNKDKNAADAVCSSIFI
jgi:hypothetical protein